MWLKYLGLFEILCTVAVLSDWSQAQENQTSIVGHSTLGSTFSERQQGGSGAEIKSDNSKERGATTATTTAATTTTNSNNDLLVRSTISSSSVNSNNRDNSNTLLGEKRSYRKDKKLNYFDDLPIKFSSKVDVGPLKSWSLSDKYSKLALPPADDQSQQQLNYKQLSLLDKPLFSVSSSTSSPDYISHHTSNKRPQTFSSSFDSLSDQATTRQPFNDNDYSSLRGESESQKVLQDELNNPDIWSTTNELGDEAQPSTTKSSRGMRYPKQYRMKATSYSSSDNFSPLGKSSLRYLYDEDGASKPTSSATIAASEFQSPPRLRLANSGIHLQQVYPPLIQQQQQHIQQYSQPAVFSLATVPNSLRSFSAGSGSNVYMSTVAPAINYETASSYRNTAGSMQRDLLHQPQTIQITSIPSGFGNTAPIVRVGSLGGGLGSWFNGQGGVNQVNSYLDPLGRQVMMVNADRRQIDWSFWIWPLIAVIAMPLVLGALLVPVFLKTVVVIIQLLQSLGLLLPLANALGQQIAHASTSAIGNNQIEQGKT